MKKLPLTSDSLHPRIDEDSKEFKQLVNKVVSNLKGLSFKEASKILRASHDKIEEKAKI